MRDLVIVGDGRNAQALIALVAAINRDRATWRVSAVLPAAAPVTSIRYAGVSTTGLVSDGVVPDAWVVVACSAEDEAPARVALLDRLTLDPAHWAILVHPSACVSHSARIEPGAVLFAGVVIGPDATVGRHAVVGAGSTIGHDAVLADGAEIGRRVAVSGSVRIGRGARVGDGASIREGLALGAGCVVRAGSVVIRDVAAEAVVGGNPARILLEAPRTRQDA